MKRCDIMSKYKGVSVKIGTLGERATDNISYYCDTRRHLVCTPYSINNLHKMAEHLDIKRCWFHKDHYDIPKKRIEEIMSHCVVVDSRMIVDIIKGGYDYEPSLCTAKVPGFEITQFQYEGTWRT